MLQPTGPMRRARQRGRGACAWRSGQARRDRRGRYAGRLATRWCAAPCSGRASSADAGPSVDEIGQGERHVARVARRGRSRRPAIITSARVEAAARRDAEVAQRRELAFADDPLGHLGDDAQHAAGGAGCRRRAASRRRCDRSLRRSRCVRDTAAAPRPRSPRRCASTCSMRGPISGQISAQTLSDRLPITQSRLMPTVGRYASLQRKVSSGPQAIHMAKRDVSMTRTTAREAGGPVVRRAERRGAPVAGAHQGANFAGTAKQCGPFVNRQIGVSCGAGHRPIGYYSTTLQQSRPCARTANRTVSRSPRAFLGPSDGAVDV